MGYMELTCVQKYRVLVAAQTLSRAQSGSRNSSAHCLVINRSSSITLRPDSREALETAVKTRHYAGVSYCCLKFNVLSNRFHHCQVESALGISAPAEGACTLRGTAKNIPKIFRNIVTSLSGSSSLARCCVESMSLDGYHTNISSFTVQVLNDSDDRDLLRTLYRYLTSQYRPGLLSLINPPFIL